MGTMAMDPRRTAGRRRPTLPGTLVALLALVLVLPLAPLAVGADPASTAATSSVPPSASSPPSGLDGWQPVEVPPLTPVAGLTPSASSDDGIPVDATFTLSSLGAAPAHELAQGLTVEPATDLRVEQGADPSSVVLRPAATLEPGAPYRFTLHGEDGSALGSWVYRTRAPLQVVETLPRHEATGVPTSTGIEITFDRDGVLAPERSFSIRPAVPGRFERRGRVLAFVPDRPLESDTIYRVTLEPGIRVVGSDQVLEEAVRFAFQTRAPRERDRAWVQFANQVVETIPAAPPVMEVYVYRHPEDRVPVQIHRFATLEAVTDALRDLRSGPEWAESSVPALSTGGLDLVGTVQGRLQRIDRDDSSDRVLTLPQPLPVGWYLLTIAADVGSTQQILQVTDLAAYAHLTWTDSLVWVNSAGRRGAGGRGRGQHRRRADAGHHGRPGSARRADRPAPQVRRPGTHAAGAEGRLGRADPLRGSTRVVRHGQGPVLDGAAGRGPLLDLLLHGPRRVSNDRQHQRLGHAAGQEGWLGAGVRGAAARASMTRTTGTTTRRRPS